MTGPGHYREAEELLASAKIAIGQYEEHAWAAKRGVAGNLTEQAQVHATLALAAATAFAADMTAGEWPGWRDAAGSEETRADGAS